MSVHGMATRSSWWDTRHWVLCTCGELIKGDSMESTARSWRNHAAPVMANPDAAVGCREVLARKRENQ